MATRIYLPSSGAIPIPNNPTNSTWTETTGFDRVGCSTSRGVTAMTNKTQSRTANAANNTWLDRVYVAGPLAGQTFGATTIKGTIRALESAANDNVDAMRLVVRVVAPDGTTFRGTIFGPSNSTVAEFNTSLRAKRLATGGATTSVVVTEGDFLVIEIGATATTGGTSISTSINYGDNSATDLGDNETDTAANNPFVDFAANMKFLQKGYGQAQADIKVLDNEAFGQAQADIEAVGQGYGQSQCDIKAVGYGFGQAQADIKAINNGLGQANCDIKTQGWGSGQAQCYIPIAPKPTGQANSIVGVPDNIYTAIDEIVPDDSDYATQKLPTGTYTVRVKLSEMDQPFFGIDHIIRYRFDSFGGTGLTVKLYEGTTLIATDSQSSSGFSAVEYRLSPAEISSIVDYTNLAIEFTSTERTIVSWVEFQAPAGSGSRTRSGQAQAKINAFNVNGCGQAQCDIKAVGYGLGQAQCDVLAQGYGLGQAQCDVKAQGYGLGQAQCDVKTQGYGLGQAQCTIRGNAYGQAQCDIKQVYSQCGQAQCDVKRTQNGHGQAQCLVQNNYYGFGQANCDIKAVISSCGQAQCYIPSDMTCIVDEFDRIVGTGWGTGAIGAWTSQGSNGIDSVDGTYGLDDWKDFGFGDFWGAQIAHSTDVPAPAVTADIWEEQIDFTWADATGGTVTNFRTIAPVWYESSIDLEHGVGVEVDALAGTIGAFWYDPDTGADDPQSITVDLTANAHIKLRYDKSTATVSAKYWEDPDAEPGYQSTVGGVLSDLGATPVLWLQHNSLQTAPAGLTTSQPLAVDTISFCYGDAQITYGTGQAQCFVQKSAGYGQCQADIKAKRNGHGQAQCEIDAGGGGCTQIYYDTFSRISSGNPGTPDIGNDWRDSVALSTDYTFVTTNGSELVLTGNTDYDFYTIATGTDGDVADGEVTIDFKIDENRNWATLFNHIARWNISQNIQFYGYYDPDQAKTLIWLQETGVSGINEFAEIDDIIPGDWYRTKLSLSGATVQGKVWNLNDAEPAYQVSAGGAVILASGATGFYADVGEAGSYPAEFLYDNVTICEAQAAEITAGYGNAQCFVRKSAGRGQALATIKGITSNWGQAKTDIKTQGIKFGQAQALILKWAGYGQARTDIKTQGFGSGQAICSVNRQYKFGLAQAYITHHQGYGQAQCFIDARKRFGQAQCQVVKVRASACGQATCLVNSSIKQGWGQAQAYIYNLHFGQAQAKIQKVVIKSAQAQAFILTGWSWAQAQATIHVSGSGIGYAQCLINLRLGTGQARCFIGSWGWAQAEAYITRPQGYGLAMVEIADHNSGQAQCYIRNTLYVGGQAQGFIIKSQGYGQAQGYIKNVATKGYGQAQTMVRSRAALAQAQCRIVLINKIATGQARVVINNNTHTGQAQTQIFGSTFSPTYQINYNGRVLPGYVNSESYDSVMNIYQAEPAYMDLKFAEYTGLQNKVISLQFKAWTNNSFVESKQDTQLAATIIRSNREGFVPLYIQSMDKHYLALAKKFTTNNDTKATHTYDYQVEFECKPWLISDATNTISGTGLIDTGVRTLDNGGWTPVRISVTGTDVTVSGYTATGDFTGFISISGGVSGLEINSESYTALIAGINRNDVMNNLDYALYVGPGQTFFEVDGGSVTIEWEDRHYL